MSQRGFQPLVWVVTVLLCLWPRPSASASPAALRVARTASKSGAGGPSLSTALALRTGALATAQLDLMGPTLDLPSTPIQVPQNAQFTVPVTLNLGGKPVSAAQASAMFPANGALQGFITGPGLPRTALSGTLGKGLSVPGLPAEGPYTVSDVSLVTGSRVLMNARPSTLTVTSLGQILLTSVTSSPMSLAQLKEAGVELRPGDYVGRRFEMVLSIGGQNIKLDVPVAIPTYNGLPDPRDSGSGPGGGMSIGNIHSDAPLPSGVSLVIADIMPPSDPFSLSRPALSFQLHNNFKALLVVPGSIGYLKQIYKVNVVVFNALDAASPYKVTHLKAQWVPPPGLDGVVGTPDDPLQPTKDLQLTQDLVGPDGVTPSIAGGQNAAATFTVVGEREGSHPLNFLIQGQFEGGDLASPVALSGTATGKVLVENPNFNLMLVHPDVVRRGQTYVLEAHLTNVSKVDAQSVSLSLDQARLSGVQIVGDAIRTVDTLHAGETAVMRFNLQSIVSGQVTSSYLYIEKGSEIEFQLSTGIGARGVTLNPDTLSLPDSLSGLPAGLRESMLALLNAAFDVASSQKALPDGVLPIPRSTITTGMAQNLSQEGLFMGMGMDRSRIWLDLWTLFMMNPDAGFDQLVRTTAEGAAFRAAMLDAWQTWAQPSQGLADLLPTLGRFGNGITGGTLVAVQGAAPGLSMSLQDDAGVKVLGTAGGASSIPGPYSAWGASTDGALQLAQMPMAGSARLAVKNEGATPQTFRMAMLAPVTGQAAPAVNTFDMLLGPGESARFDLGGAEVRGVQGFRTLDPVATVASLPPEPFQVLGVHRWDLSISGAASPSGTQVLVLFNRPNKELVIGEGEAGFQAASLLVNVEANAFWRKAMAPLTDAQGGIIVDASGKPVIPPCPAALVQVYPRVVSCYLEKPVGPYVERKLTLKPGWFDTDNHPLQGTLAWPIQSGLLPGGAVVKGHFRKLDGTGVKGQLTYWYQQFISARSGLDLQTGIPLADEVDETYYALVTNNVDTGDDGSYQLDYVPAPYGDFIGPFVLQGGFPGGTAFAQASVLGNGQVVQMDLVLEGSGSVEGHIVDAMGQPIPGVAVLALQEQRSCDFTRGTSGGSFSVGGTTDAVGHFRLDGLKTGIFCLQALKGELGAVSGGQIQSDGQVVALDMVLQGKVGTIKAHVLDLEGKVRMDQAVRLGIPGGLMRDASSASNWVFPVEQRPGPDGWATFTTVPAGDVQIIAPYSAPTPAPGWQGFLEGGKALQVELKMVDPTQMATVQCLVKDGAGNPVAGAYLKFDDTSWTHFVSQSGADGMTPKVQVTPGIPITGHVYHPSWVGYYSTGSVVPQAGGNFVLSVVLPLRCTLAGKVTRPGGTPVAGAYVAIPPVWSDRNKNRLCVTDANGAFVIPDIPVGSTYRVAAVGPELLTSVNEFISVKPSDTTFTINLTLPDVAHNTLTGRVYQPPMGNGQDDIPTKAMVVAYGQLPSIGTGGEEAGNWQWGLPEQVITGGVAQESMLSDPDHIGFFSIPNLPAGPYTLMASSSIFPTAVGASGDFGTAVAKTDTHNFHLRGNDAGVLQGRIVLPDGQTPVAPGARVMLLNGSSVFLQVLSQPGGSFAFAKVVPPSPFTLRVEDPVTGHVFEQAIWLGPQEVRTLPIRLWGTGDLTVLVQDSFGNPLPYGDVTLQHSLSGVCAGTDMPLLQLPLTPADQGTLHFPHLLEGAVTVILKNPTGLSGVASVTMPVGGGNQTVVVRLQAVGRIKGTLVRADGTVVASGRVDAYQGGRWLGTSPTYQENTPGEFLFDPLPIGAIRLEAWDPDSRQTGQVTVNVEADQTTTLTMTTLDTGQVTIQVLQEGQPVLRAGINVQYSGGPALNFATQATADLQGLATFILPPGTYSVTATDPVSLAQGAMSFTRGLDEGPRSETLSIQPVRSILATALPPQELPGVAAQSLAGWRVTASGVNRSASLDSSNQATLQEMPVGGYTLSLSDAQGRYRGSRPFQVTLDGGAVQVAQVQARAIGNLQVTVLDAGGVPAVGALVYADGGSQGQFTDLNGLVTFYGIGEGMGNINAMSGFKRAHGTFSIASEGEMATATLTFAPTASLHGVVLDPLGNPVPFIGVSCGGLVPDSATGADGHFTFTGLPIQRSITLVATSAQGRMGVAAPVTLAEGDDLEVDITLRAMGTLRGRIADPLRPVLPCLGIQVLNAGGQVLATGSTDETGAFELLHIPAGQDLVLRVLWDDGTTEALRQGFTVPGEGQTANLALQLPAFSNVTGWTRDGQGATLPMYVQLLDGQGSLLAQAATTIDIPTFHFRYLKAGTPYLLVGIDQYTRARIASQVYTPTGQQVLDEVFLVPPTPRSLALQLRYPDGSAAPLAGVKAQIAGRGPLGGTWTGTFDAAGHLGIDQVIAGPVSVTVSSLPWQDPFTLQGTVADLPGLQSLDIPVRGMGSVSVQTLTAAGKPVAQGPVTLAVRGRTLAGSLQAGVFVWPQVPVGENLTVTASGNALGFTSTLALAPLSSHGETRQATLTVPYAGSVTGHLLDADGQPVAGAPVQLFLSTCTPGLWDTRLPIVQVLTGADGSFAIQGLPLSQSLRLYHLDDQGDFASSRFQVDQDQQEVPCDLRKHGLGSMDATVTEFSGTPLPGLKVTLTQADAPTLQATTDALGKALLDKVPAGMTWSAAVTLPIKGAQTRPFSTLRGQTTPISWQDQGFTRLVGPLRRASGLGFPAGTSLVPAGRAAVAVAPDGSFAPATLPLADGATTWNLSLQINGLNLGSWSQPIAGDGDTTPAVVPPFGAVAAAVLKRDGSPAPGVAIALDGAAAGLTGTGGSWSRDGQPLGTHHLAATCPYGQAQGDITVAADGSVALLPLQIQPNVQISVNPAAPALLVNGTQAFVATVTGTDNPAVTWSVQEGPAGGTVSATGMYQAPATAGLYHVVVTSVDDPSRSVTTEVKVKNPAAVVVTLTPGTVNVLPNGTAMFTARITGLDDQRVTWAILEGAQGGAISGSGVYTAPAQTGTYHVTATSAADPTRSASSMVVVSSQAAGNVAGVFASDQGQVTFYQLGTAVNGTWTTPAGESVQVTGTLSGQVLSGTWSAPTLSDSGRFVLTFAPDGSAFHGSWGRLDSELGTAWNGTLQVGQVSVQLSPASLTLRLGDNYAFSAQVAGTSNAGLLWTTTAGSIAPNGVFTAPFTPGIVTVTAASAFDPSKCATSTVVVGVDGNLEISGTYQTNDGTLVLYQTGSAILGDWTDSNGLSIQVQGVLAGQVLAGTWTLPANSDQGQFEITFSPDGMAFAGNWGRMGNELGAPWSGTRTAARVTLKLNPVSTLLRTGQSQEFSALVGGTFNKAVVWSASAGEISQAGIFHASDQPGLCTITATSAADPSVAATATVSVTPDGELNIGTSYQTNNGTVAFYQNGATVTGDWVDANGAPIQVSGFLNDNILTGSWTAPNTAEHGLFVIQFSANGATFQGTYGRLESFLGYAWTGTSIPGLVSVHINPPATTLKPGAVQGFSAMVAGTADKGLSWAVAEGAAGGTVDASGVYTAPAAAGTWHVTATSKADPARSARATITVADAGLLGIAGTYATNWGNLTLYQNGAAVTGSWPGAYGGSAQVSGNLNGRVLNGYWKTDNASYYGYFTLTFAADGKSCTGSFGHWTGNNDHPWSGALTAGVVSILVSPNSAVLQPGQTLAFSASVSGAAVPGLTWSATGGSIAADGLYSAPSEPGLYTVSCRSLADGSPTATATVVVTAEGVLSIAGDFSTNWGEMTLYQSGTTVTGTWPGGYGGPAQITGTLTGRVLTGSWRGVAVSGPYYGLFVLTFSADGKSFSGNFGHWTGNNDHPWSGTQNAGVVSIALAPASIVLRPGQTQAFEASVAGSYNLGVQWSTTGGSIAPNGVYTAPASPGVYSVTATSLADPTRTATSTVMVTSDGTLAINGTFTTNWGGLTLYQSGNSVTGVWPGCYGGAGRVTGTLAGRVLTGTWKGDSGSYYGKFVLTFTGDGRSFSGSFGHWTGNNDHGWSGSQASGAISITASPSSALLLPGQSLAFSAQVSGTFDARVLWTATGGTITADGGYTAPMTPGLYAVTAASAADPTRTATLTVMVTTSGALAANGTFTTNWGDLTLYQSGTTVTGVWPGGYGGSARIVGTLTGRELVGTWKTDSGSYYGLYTLTFAPDGKSFTGSFGHWTGIADHGWSGSIRSGNPSILLQPSTAVLSHGQVQAFTGLVSGVYDDRLTWSASGGSVDQNGIYTAPGTAGTYTVTLTSRSDPTATATATVLVIDGNPEASLVARWNFDEGSGSAISDATANGLGGTLPNPGTWVPGRAGTALQSNGVSTYLEVPSTPLLNPASLTLSMWLNLAADPNCDGNSNWRSLAHKGAVSGSTTGYDVVLGDLRNILWETGTGTCDSWWPQGLTVPVGSWTHLVLTYDARTGVKQAYQDGLLRDSHTVAVPAPLAANTAPFRFNHPAASATPNGSGNFNGAVDDLRVYSRALSASEVAALYGPVVISPRTFALKPGQTATFQATLTDPAAAPVVWGAGGGSITPGGVFTAPLAAGVYKVTAYSPSSPGQWDQVLVTVTDYDAAADFSAAQNPVGPWSYGMTPTLGGGFQLYTSKTNSGLLDHWIDSPSNAQVDHGAGTWSSLGAAYSVTNQIVVHPGSGGQYTVLRWTAPQAGSYAVRSSFSGWDPYPTTTDVHVLRNGLALFNGNVTTFQFGPSYSGQVDLQAGDTVDFAVGFGNGNYYYDSTGASATISAVHPGIALNPAEATLAPGQVLPLSGTASGLADGTLQWSVLEGQGGGSVTPAGVYTAPPAPGIYHVVAASAVDSTVTAIVTLFVRGNQ